MVLKGETFKDKNISTGIEAKNDKSFELAKQMFDKAIMIFDESKLNESIAAVKVHITNETLLTALPLT